MRYIHFDIAIEVTKQGLKILIRGTGDVGSAVAVLLVRAGYGVALHEESLPTVTRRGMAFADAVFDGSAILAGFSAHCVRTVEDLQRILGSGEIPVAFGPLGNFINATNWRVLIDARMRKRVVPEHQRGMAPMTIGLGPNFIAGDNVDLAIETEWGDRLGAVVKAGATQPVQGEPQEIGGAARERFVYAPAAGLIETSMRIGDHVEKDDVVATISGVKLRAPLSGTLRGLTHDGVDVALKTKVMEIDPRDNPASCFGLGVRPQRIAEGVLRALADTGISAVA